MHLTDKEASLVCSLRTLNVALWQLVDFVPVKGNTALLAILESVINETDALVARFDHAAGDTE